jgi:hypothetical protein
MPPIAPLGFTRGSPPQQLDIGVPAGNTAAKAAQLAGSTLVFTLQFVPLKQALRGGSGSAHLDTLARRLGEAHLHNIFVRNLKAKSMIDRVDTNHPDAVKPEEILRRLGRPSSAQPTTLAFVKQSSSNFYAPKSDSVHLVDPSNLPYAAHELRHAYDQATGKMDLSQPAHRLASELNAFGSQVKAAAELGIASGISRTPLEQARTYEGKDPVNYPGTIESSQAAVAEWRAAKAGDGKVSD